METGFLLAIIGMIFIAFSNIITKKLSLEFEDIFSTFLYFLSTTFFATALFILFGNFNFVWNLQNILYLFGAGISGLLTIYFLLKSFSYFSVGVSLTLFNTYFLWNYFFDVFLGKQSISIVFMGVIGLFLLGLFLIFNLRFTQQDIRKELLYPIISAFSLFILTRINSILINSGVEAYTSTFLTELSIFIVTLIYLLSQRFHVVGNIKKLHSRQWTIIAGVGFFNYIGVLFLNKSYLYLEVFITNIINSSQIIVTLIFSYLIFKEKLNTKQFLGVASIINALFLVYTYII